MVADEGWSGLQVLLSTIMATSTRTPAQASVSTSPSLSDSSSDLVLSFVSTTTRGPTPATATVPATTTTRPQTPSSSLGALPATFSITSPVSVVYCEQVVVNWSGGVGLYSLEAHAPTQNITLIAQTNETSWSFYNNRIPAGSIMSISVKDSQDNKTSEIFVVDGTDAECPATPVTTTLTMGPVATGIVGDSKNTLELPGAAIAGIVFAALAFLLVVGTAIWLYRRKAASRPHPILPYNPNREGKAGDRSSVISGKSAGSMKSAHSARSVLSLWSTFSNRNIERSYSVEDGVRVEIDTVQVMEEAHTPVTVPASGAQLYAPRRTTREWAGYGMSGNRRSNEEDGETFDPSTIISRSSISEGSTEVEYPNQPMPKPDYSPFNDNYIVHNVGDVKAYPVVSQGSSHTDPSEQDASQLSQRDLEALADIVAARLNQRTDYSSSSSEHIRSAPSAIDLPPRYY